MKQSAGKQEPAGAAGRNSTMEKAPEVVARLADARREENWRLRTYLKRSPTLRSSHVDHLADEAGRHAEAEMDCTTCGACCRDICIPVTDHEIDRLARRLGIDTESFRQRYMTTNDDGEAAIDATPCPFLEGSMCAVYEDRPDACRGYPYIGGNVASRMIGIIERAETCPIVYAMLESLKDQLGFRRLC